MKLSIIIPVYNGSRFINKSYQSLMNQELDDLDYELLYIDNNSIDNSVEIIKDLRSKNSNIKLFNQPKQGEAHARNMGIEMAQGELLYQLDVDDEIFPGALKRMKLVLDEHYDVDAVFGKMLKTDKSISELNKPLVETHKVTLFEKPYWGLKWFSDLNSVVGEGAFLHRKEVFEEIGNYTEQLPIIGTDLAFDIKLGMTSNLAYLDTYIYLYFKHEISLIQGVKKKMPRAFMVWPRLVREHLPFYLEQEVPLKFKTLLFAQLYQSMGRQIEYTNGFSKRQQLKLKLLSEIGLVSVPRIIRLYLGILVFLPLEPIRKVYSYHIVPMVIKRIKE